MVAHGIPKANVTLSQTDKGHVAELAAFRDAASSGERFPIPWEELVETWNVSWLADQICRKGEVVKRSFFRY
jgi:hypothetical protein